ncbi:hypothetical protein [Lactiplantibacillus plantarum]|uniref:hypothetical protein n=1 Tax=Lactiplantibacillus plantarum TaxID=1590 RepID=UPI0006AD7F96|nr:hypothetical protein [Lactiplantibacillus plantarum]WGS68710.1 hypothetical protein NQL29_14900 [Lactiplantibacillus plantarum]
MEVSHTLDGYWILAGWIDREHEDAQATMKQAKEQFIKANPLIDPSKVVVVNGEFKQAINNSEFSKSLASMIIDGAN